MSDPVAPPSEPPASPSQRPALAWPVVAVLAALAVVGAAAFVVVRGGDDEATDPGADPAAADLSEVDVYEDLSREHVTGEVDYPQSPPVGGEHDQAWHECGVYDEPVRDEHAVHSLEHGTVWVTYRPGLSEADVETLAAALPEDSLVSPYDDQEAPVVVTVWERQLALDGPDDSRLELFVEEFGDGHTSPEPLVTCAGGVIVSEDGTAGSSV